MADRLQTDIRAGDAAAVSRVLLNRMSVKDFDASKAVDAGVLGEVLALAQRAPCGFAAYPYVCVVVRGAAARQALSKAMLGPNKKRVADAPVTVVFASRLDPVKQTAMAQAIATASGAPAAYVGSLPQAITAFTTKFNTPTEWSFKMTMLAVQNLIISASSHGLGALAMEGFIQQKVLAAVKLPAADWKVPCVVSLGHPLLDSPENAVTNRRFAPQDVFYSDAYSSPLAADIVVPRPMPRGAKL